MYFQNAIADKLKVTRPTKEESGEDYKKADKNPQDGKIDQAEFKNMLNDLAKSAEAKHLASGYVAKKGEAKHLGEVGIGGACSKDADC